MVLAIGVGADVRKGHVAQGHVDGGSGGEFGCAKVRPTHVLVQAYVKRAVDADKGEPIAATVADSKWRASRAPGQGAPGIAAGIKRCRRCMTTGVRRFDQMSRLRDAQRPCVARLPLRIRLPPARDVTWPSAKDVT